MEELQERLEQLYKKGYYFMCTNNALGAFNDDLAPDGEYVVVIGKAGLQHSPTAIHKDLKTAISEAIAIVDLIE